MRLLILDNHDSFTYNLVQLVEESRLCKFDVIKNDEIKIEQLQKYNKILISPGPGLPRETANLKQIIDKYHKTKSILGVCLGLQAICEYFGATLYNFNQVFHGLQTQIQILDTQDYIYTGLNPLINVGLYHSWAVSEKKFPTELKITAVSYRGVIMSVKHKKYDIRGIQYHPESIMTNFGKKILENWLSK